MNLIACFFVLFGCAVASNYMQMVRNRIKRLPRENSSTPRTSLRDRVANRIQRHRERSTSRVCYDTVGCFEVPHSRSPLQKSPESPDILDTKFFLFRRNINFSEPQILYYADNGTSVTNSKFDVKQNLKIYIHGYMTNWNQKIAFVAADAYLKLEDCNFVVMDWSKGARGPQYATAAANTEIAGRQLGLLLLHLVNKGLRPKQIHMIGFSLGAHVAGCAAELLKTKGSLVGRITGLDPAAPLFRNNHLKEKSKKLDKSDAEFVDVLHTDSSPVFVDGFGLWEPIGHVDFFANGGMEQPGCTDQHASVFVTTLERTLTRDSACSHIRAPQLFFESLVNKVSGNSCEFVTYKCPGGLPSFEKGQCFPQIEDKSSNPLALDKKFYTDLGTMGQFSEGVGVQYFTTRDTAPYCGTQLQTTVIVSKSSQTTRGILYLILEHSKKSRTTFKINCEVQDAKKGVTLQGLAAADYNSLKVNDETLLAHMSYYNYEYKDQENKTVMYPKTVRLDKVVITDIDTNSWYYCGGNTAIGGKSGQQQKATVLKMSKKKC